MSDHVKDNVLSIINDIENGIKPTECPHCGEYLEEDREHQDECPSCGDPVDELMSGIDYLSDVLDINWIVSNDRKECLGARLLVAFGGPTLWINTQMKQVEGYWWGDSYTGSYSGDPMDIEGAVQEFWECK